MTNNYSEISDRDNEFELIVRQALKLKTWNRKCAKKMKQFKISKESVELEVARRKSLLAKDSDDSKQERYAEKMLEAQAVLGEDAHGQPMDFAYREQKLEIVVRKALSSSSTWKEDSEAVMRIYGITIEEVEAEVNKRKKMIR